MTDNELSNMLIQSKYETFNVKPFFIFVLSNRCKKLSSCFLIIGCETMLIRFKLNAMIKFNFRVPYCFLFNFVAPYFSTSFTGIIECLRPHKMDWVEMLLFTVFMVLYLRLGSY